LSLSLQYYQDEENAKDYLAESLHRGSLALVLGAGISMDLGLPSWPELVRRCAESRGLSWQEIDTAKPSALALQIVANRIEADATNDVDFAKTVERALYDKVELTPDSVVPKLLLALGALIMSSRRGAVSKVLTYNFDSVLEWYLRLHGYCVRVVQTLPSLVTVSDVDVYHVHGYTPHSSSPDRSESRPILGLDAVDARLSEAMSDPWFRLVHEVVTSHDCLFVGLSDKSFSDRAIHPVLIRARKAVGIGRPLGIWCFGEPLEEGAEGDFFNAGVVPLVFPSVFRIPPFLLGICQRAAEIAVK